MKCSSFVLNKHLLMLCTHQEGMDDSAKVGIYNDIYSDSFNISMNILIHCCRVPQNPSHFAEQSNAVFGKCLSNSCLLQSVQDCCLDVKIP